MAWRTGKVVTGIISETKRNGILSRRGSKLNLGPFPDGVEGGEVTALVLDNTWGWCLTRDLTYNVYDELFIEHVSHKAHPTFFKHLNEAVDSGEDAGNGVNSNETYDVRIFISYPSGHYSLKNGSPIRITESGLEPGNQYSVEVKSVDRMFAEATIVEDKSRTIEESSIEPNTERGISDSQLLDMRKKAEEAAVNEVPEQMNTSTSSTEQYSRSQEVREYVKERANGVCEGCDEPAPFTSKTGNPYLHAHHIHELSDGGSDTPDTVVALCPNCHYRIHHGENGQRFNQKLLEKVRNMES